MAADQRLWGYPAIAAHLGISIGAARSRRSRGALPVSGAVSAVARLPRQNGLIERKFDFIRWPNEHVRVVGLAQEVANPQQKAALAAEIKRQKVRTGPGR